jgi:hypothetical protein
MSTTAPQSEASEVGYMMAYLSAMKKTPLLVKENRSATF